jgi:ferredoxin
MRRLPALFRAAAAAAVTGLFIYAYLSSKTAAAGLLAPLVKIQFSAAVYGAWILAAGILGAALVSGRVFCSVLCPLGTLQELVWKVGNLLRKKGSAQTYRSPPRLRYAVLILAGVLAFFFPPLMTILDPVSNFGRGMAALRAPSAAAFLAALPVLLILVPAFLRGRVFCDWCPAGLVMSLFSWAAPLGIRISSRCVSCGICEKKCPVSCIDPRSKSVDRERCILCFSCVSACPSGGVVYRAGRARSAGPDIFGAVSGDPGNGRRIFLRRAGAVVCGAAYLLAPGLRKLLPRPAETDRLILPPGAKNLALYRARCIGCQACAAACPSGIIRIKKTLNPVLDYTDAACQYNCTVCGEVCPTGAINRLELEEKHTTRIALSTLYFEYCVVKTRHEACGACAEVCPTRALRMEAYPESGVPYLTRPLFDEPYCVGCGACLTVCPARPRAFSVLAVDRQSLTPGIRPTEEAGSDGLYQAGDDFPF